MPTRTRIDIADALVGREISEIADALGVTNRTVYRMLRNGVDVYTADKIATKVLGDSPIYVWGRSWTDAVGDAE